MNNSTEDNVECPGDSDIVRTVKVMSIMLLAGFGVFGNVLVIVIAVKYTRQTNIHHLIISMAVSDALVILLYTLEQINVITNKYYSGITPNFEGSWNACEFIRFLLSTSTIVSLLTLVIISIERYRATRVTALRLRPYTKRQRVTTVTCSWGLSMAYSSFNFFAMKSYSENGNYFCVYVSQSIGMKIGMFTGCTIFILSLLLIVLLSILTSLRLRRPSVVQANLSDIQRQVRAKRISNVVRMVVCSILLYAVCYSSSFFWIAYVFKMSIDGSSYDSLGLGCKFGWLLFMTEFLILVNSCFSPYICIIFLTEFRETTKRLLFPKPQPTQQTSLELGAVIDNQGLNNHSGQDTAM